MKTIVATFKNIDNDLSEYNLIKALESLGCKDITIKRDTKEFYDNDENFRKLAKAQKEAKKKYNDYLNKKLLKQ